MNGPTLIDLEGYGTARLKGTPERPNLQLFTGLGVVTIADPEPLCRLTEALAALLGLEGAAPQQAPSDHLIELQAIAEAVNYEEDEGDPRWTLLAAVEGAVETVQELTEDRRELLQQRDQAVGDVTSLAERLGLQRIPADETAPELAALRGLLVTPHELYTARGYDAAGRPYPPTTAEAAEAPVQVLAQVMANQVVPGSEDLEAAAFAAGVDPASYKGWHAAQLAKSETENLDAFEFKRQADLQGFNVAARPAAEEPPKKKRRTKAEIEAEKAAKDAAAAAGPGLPPDANAVPQLKVAEVVNPANGETERAGRELTRDDLIDLNALLNDAGLAAGAERNGWLWDNYELVADLTFVKLDQFLEMKPKLKKVAAEHRLRAGQFKPGDGVLIFSVPRMPTAMAIEVAKTYGLTPIRTTPIAEFLKGVIYVNGLRQGEDTEQPDSVDSDQWAMRLAMELKPAIDRPQQAAAPAHHDKPQVEEVIEEEEFDFVDDEDDFGLGGAA